MHTCTEIRKIEQTKVYLCVIKRLKQWNLTDNEIGASLWTGKVWQETQNLVPLA